MYQFFVPEENTGPEYVQITGSDVNHIKNVLRMRRGEKIRVSTPAGDSWFCRIEELSAELVTARIEEADRLGTEPVCKVYLFQGLPKGDKMEFVVQKAVELGVHEIIPVAMKNCVVKLDEQRAANKTKRWQSIAESAAKQAKRSVIPAVRTPVSFREAVKLAGELSLVTLVPYEKAHGLAATRELMGGIPRGAGIGLMIGPEGGFAPEEIDCADESGFHCISLGRRILRTETAGAAALAMLVYALDE
ncbi:MAG: 16S rRNA (uracil(1498)-N(3))-methyltransferase [Muribaculaceae bacterium]|nr:16S rRNA (uracil(1498)-N(3))-methyltransferase [Roseburia sp.]MCM1431304.1 16S rRNA (uracil(1498)-N(3))-methyltransferase [Muribaculaceae bacterium]MCM1492210.1 16S rRNA (uracil(1498)-N(3))-methyltransferase [Muribaculaceae bacterium]